MEKRNSAPFESGSRGQSPSVSASGFDLSRDQLHTLKRQIEAAHGPDRRLDLALTRSLPIQAKWRGRLLTQYPHVMAFSRSVEVADRFLQISLPGWDYTLSTYRKRAEYHATLWSPDGNCDDEGRGATPALALLSGAVATAIEEGGWRQTMFLNREPLKPEQRARLAQLATEKGWKSL